MPRKPATRKLTAKEEQFCREYLLDLNGAQAAIRAGYSERTARQKAHQLMAMSHIEKRIAELKTKRAERTEINADYVLRRHVAIDEMDIADILDDDGRLKPVSEWPETWRRTLSGIEISELFEGGGDERTLSGLLKKIKWPDKLKNLELLGRHTSVGAYKDTVDHNHKFANMTEEQLNARLQQLLSSRSAA